MFLPTGILIDRLRVTRTRVKCLGPKFVELLLQGGPGLSNRCGQLGLPSVQLSRCFVQGYRVKHLSGCFRLQRTYTGLAKRILMLQCDGLFPESIGRMPRRTLTELTLQTIRETASSRLTCTMMAESCDLPSDPRYFSASAATLCHK